MFPGKLRRLLAVAALGLVGVAVASPPGSAGGYKSWSRRIAPGVKYTAIKDPKGPWHIDIVTVKMRKSSSMDVAIARGELAGFETVSSMARRHGAVAATNADFTLRNGRPVNTFAEDGKLVQTSIAPWGRNSLINHSETRAWFKHPQEDVRLVTRRGKARRIQRVNAGKPSKRQLALFTGYGGRLEKPPKRACSARLSRIQRYGFRSVDRYTQTKFKVRKVACRFRRMRRRGGTVVSALKKGRKDRFIRKLDRGDKLHLGWSVGQKGIFDTVGGNPILVKRGRNVAPRGSGYPFTRQPRTGVGRTGDGKILLITVDGRQPGYSVGMTFRQFARLFLSRGARWALNLDGGGSSEMVVKGRVRSSPSTGQERPTGSALLVLPGRDRGQRVTEPRKSSIVAAGSPEGAELWSDIAHDPGSTGGLAAMLEDRGARLSAGLARAAATFDSR